ncbi:MAG: hypothetical protein ABGY75_19900 [Gemmataceae bacterium]
MRVPRTGSLAPLIMAVALLVGSAATADPPKPPPITAKLVTLNKSGPLAELLAEVSRQTGLAVEAADGAAKATAAFDRTPFWAAVEQLAAGTGHRVAVDGSKVKLVKLASGVKPPPSATDGPFRAVVKKVIARKDFETGGVEYEVQLDVLWEPRFPVFLIDTDLRVTAAAAGGQKPTADSPTGRVLPVGYTHPATVRLKGVPRTAGKIDSLSGTFRVTAADHRLSVEFKDLTGDKPVTQSAEGVAVTLKPVRRLEKRVEFGFELEYPPGHPEFESFQLWAGGNRLRLIAPDNRTTYEPADYSADENGRRVRAEYSFSGPNGQPFTLPDLKGWRAVYDTPCPMVERTVTLTFKDIELP